MLIVISPAKSLDYTSVLPTEEHSQPRMLDDAASLVEVMRSKSPDDLTALMGISAKLAELNHERFNDWSTPFTPCTARPALLAFTGDVYRAMDVSASFGQRDYDRAQQVLRILSGLYGVLRPLDLIQPYRLEMGTKLVTDRGRNLYSYWGSRITDVLNSDLADSPGSDAVVNLASKEYFRSVIASELDGRLVTPTFLDGKLADAVDAGSGSPAGGGLSLEADARPPVRQPRVIGFFAKRARGAMAGWIIRHRVESVRDIREFDGLGYAFSPERSTVDKPVFVRWS